MEALPYSAEAEQAVIGGLLRDNNAWNEICDLIADRDFHRDDHRRIFRHITALLEMGLSATVATVFASLQKSDEVDQTGGLSYLRVVANSAPAAGDIRHYAMVVTDKSILRSLIGACDEIVGLAFNTAGRDVGQILDEAESRIFAIAEAGVRSRRRFETLSDALDEAVERVKELGRRDTKDGVIGVATGYRDLDWVTSGLQRGDLVVIAGRPGTGRTTLSLNIAEYVGVDLGLPVLIFSREESAPQLALRFLSSRSRVEYTKWRSCRLADEDWAKLPNVLERLQGARIYIEQCHRINAMELRAQARRVQRKSKGLALIVIDDIQMIAGLQKTEGWAVELSDVSSLLKNLAKELGVPLVVLSQLDRRLEQRANKRPVIADLPDFGAIAQDADLVMFIYRDEMYDDRSPDTGLAEIIIAKHRSGRIGTVKLRFLGEYARFENYVVASA